MTYEMNKSQFDQVLSLPAAKRYEHFISKVTDWEELWTLKGPDGLVLFGDDSGKECIPIWPHPDYASALVKNTWSDCFPEKLEFKSFMDKWIPGISQDGRFVAVFPTPNEKGIVVDPWRLKDDFLSESEQYK